MSKTLLNSVVAAVLIGCFSSNADAGFLVFTDRTSWESAVGGGITTDPFDNPIADSNQITLDSGIVSTYVNLTGPRNRVTTDGQFEGFVNQTGQIDLEWAFPIPIVGFGGDFVALNVPNGLTVVGDFDGTGVQTISIAQTIGSGSGFFGLVSTSHFDTIRFSSNDGSGTSSGELYLVDNFSFSAVPEPTSLALLGMGVTGLCGYRMRRKQKTELTA